MHSLSLLAFSFILDMFVVNQIILTTSAPSNILTTSVVFYYLFSYLCEDELKFYQ